MIIRDFQGNVVPFGKVSKVLEENFLLGTLPGWLTVSSGTATYSVPPASRGYAQLATAATNLSVARIQTFEIDSSLMNSIIWSVEGLSYDTDSLANMGLGIYGTNCGIAFFQTTANTALRMRIYDASGNTDVSFNYRIRGGGEALRRRNLKVMLLPQLEQVYLMEDDQVMYAHDLTGLLQQGNVRCIADVSTTEAVSHYMQFSQVRLELQHN